MNVFNRSDYGFMYLEALLSSHHWAFVLIDTLDEQKQHPVYVINQEELHAYTPNRDSLKSSIFMLREASYVGMTDSGSLVGITLMQPTEECCEKYSKPERLFTPEFHLLGFLVSTDGNRVRISRTVVLVPRAMQDSANVTFIREPGTEGIDPLSDEFLTIIGGFAAAYKAFETDTEMGGGISSLNKVINELMEN